MLISLKQQHIVDLTLMSKLQNVDFTLKNS